MPTANYEVQLCTCGHGRHAHDLRRIYATTQTNDLGKVLPAACLMCACLEFQRAGDQAVQEGEERRRLTED